MSSEYRSIQSRYGLIKVTVPSKTTEQKESDVMLVFNDFDPESIHNGQKSSFHPIVSMSELEDFIYMMNGLYPAGWSFPDIANKLFGHELTANHPAAIALAAKNSHNNVPSTDGAKYAKALAVQKGEAPLDTSNKEVSSKVITGPWNKKQ